MNVDIKAFGQPDRRVQFERGFFEVVDVGGMTIGRATYEPGWKWSEHVGGAIGQRWCTVEHIGMVVSGTATAAFEDGSITRAVEPGSRRKARVPGRAAPRPRAP